MNNALYPVPASSEITPESAFLDRRKFILGATGLAMAGFAGDASAKGQLPLKELKTVKSPFSTSQKPNSFKDITSYNNFYEFGTGKSDPAQYASALTTDPWSIKVDGLLNNPGQIDIEDLLTKYTLEERIYRLRCVEAWSMVVPWVGIPLASVLKKFDIQGNGKYVAFETLKRPSEMRGQRSGFGGVPWPYVEGLRMDEAMHPLTMLAVGVYGKTMLNQNGAPVRLVVPWKYGFKSIKSIVRISITDKQPPSSWNILIPREYGFYSNVNPQVDHPRWSQASERVIGAGVFAKRAKTQMFNGYADQVSSLYAGMDLKKNY
ncbi:MAG: sulfoxide reductase catalytic subunit YedY [Hyphomicrobiaceae bacterium]|jgi:sulfoxide reductase catalytic subunit YedY